MRSGAFNFGRQGHVGTAGASRDAKTIPIMAGGFVLQSWRDGSQRQLRRSITIYRHDRQRARAATYPPRLHRIFFRSHKAVGFAALSQVQQIAILSEYEWWSR